MGKKKLYRFVFNSKGRTIPEGEYFITAESAVGAMKKVMEIPEISEFYEEEIHNITIVFEGYVYD